MPHPLGCGNSLTAGHSRWLPGARTGQTVRQFSPSAHGGLVSAAPGRGRGHGGGCLPRCGGSPIEKEHAVPAPPVAADRHEELLDRDLVPPEALANHEVAALRVQRAVLDEFPRPSRPQAAIAAPRLIRLRDDDRSVPTRPGEAWRRRRRLRGTLPGSPRGGAP